MILFLRNLVLRWLRLATHEERLTDLERHFVTKRDAQGMPTETLADVPIEKRAELRAPRLRGLSWAQRRAYLEATDGETRAAVPQRIAGNS